MDNWAHKDKDPNELLTIFAGLDGSSRVGAQYTCKYIEGILENKGYDIVIHDNTYRLEPHIPKTREKMYEMPIKELMDLHHKLVMKTSVQYIPSALRKTLIRRTKSIIINRGYRVDYDDKDVPKFRITEEWDKFFNEGVKIFDNLKDATLYNQITGNNDWVVASAMTEMCKENDLNKENNMKNIFIKFENKHLVNYVSNKLAKTLFKKDITSSNLLEGSADYYGIHIVDKTMKITACFAPNLHKESKNFIITCASNADIIIEEVIKEYNKPNFKEFVIGGEFNGNTIKVEVHKDKVVFNGELLSIENATKLCVVMLGSFGGYLVGGSSAILLTGISGRKVYADRSEFQRLFDAIVDRHNA